MSADRAYYSFINFVKTNLAIIDPDFTCYEERIAEDETGPYLNFSRGSEFIDNRSARTLCQAWVVVNKNDLEPPMLTLDKAIQKLRAITLDNGPLPLFDNYAAGSPQIGYFYVALTEISQRSFYQGQAQCVMTWQLSAIDTTPPND